jgi:hypothetical protein
MLRKNEQGDFTWEIRDDDDTKDLFGEILQTPIGKRFKQDFFSPEKDAEYTELWRNTIEKISKSKTTTLTIALHALRLLMDSGSFAPKNPTEYTPLAEPVPEVEVPKDKNGKPLTDAQLKWRAFGEYERTHSVADCRARAQRESDFGTYYRKKIEGQWADVQSSGGAVLLNDRSTNARKSGPALQEFARLYIKEPIANLQPKGGFVTLGGEQIDAATFRELQIAAASKGLI